MKRRNMKLVAVPIAVASLAAVVTAGCPDRLGCRGPRRRSDQLVSSDDLRDGRGGQDADRCEGHVERH